MGQEQLIKCVMAHSLMWSVEEGAVDRVAAIGMCSRRNHMIETGDAMLRVNALDSKALRKVVLLVVRRLHYRFRIDRGFAEKIAFATLHELLRANCIHCGGKGELHSKGAVTVVCSHCNGSGLHCYTNKDRLALIGSRYNQAAYEDALNYLRDSTVNIVTLSNKRLGD